MLQRLVRRPDLLAIATVLVLLVAISFGALVTAPTGEGETVLLSINDVYRLAGVDRGKIGGLARVRALREELAREHPDMVTLLAGDFLSPSLLSRTYHGEQMVDVLNLLDGRPGLADRRFLVTFGNHELAREVPAEELVARLDQSEFAWLGSNIDFAAGFPDERLRGEGKLLDRTLIESGGLTLGFFGLTIDDTHPAHVERFEDALTTAVSETAWLRGRGADVVVALTHLTKKQDQAILGLGERGPDLVLGGHDHVRMAVERDTRWLVKADAEARTAAVVWIHKRRGQPATISAGFRRLDGPCDPLLAQRVKCWRDRHERELCPECPRGWLDERVGSSEVELTGEEDRIRLEETNLGNWVADQMRARAGTDVAFVNGGLLRLNDDLPPGDVRERELRELVGFDSGTELVELTLTGSELRRVAQRSVREWNGSGHFLQISGFAFRHVPGNDGGRQVVDLYLVRTSEGGRPVLEAVSDERPITAVTVAYLAGGGDGYEVLAEVDEGKPGERLVEVLRQALHNAKEPIAPALDGRICAADTRERCTGIWQLTAPADGAGSPSANGSGAAPGSQPPELPKLTGTEG